MLGNYLLLLLLLLLIHLYSATFQKMLNADVPEQQLADGVDLMPLWTGQTDQLDDRSLFWHFPAYLQGKDYRGARDQHFRARPFGIIRQGHWKLIEHFEDGQLELFNLQEDLGESRNVADQHPELTKRLAQALKNWRNEIDAPVPHELNPKYQGNQVP